MYYTFNKELLERYIVKQVTLEDFLLGLGVLEQEQYHIGTVNKNITVVNAKEKLYPSFSKHKSESWYKLPKHPEWPTSELSKHYSTFYIPKKKGGMRRIDAPDDELKEFLTEMKEYFEKTLRILPHNAAHAYVKGRSTISAVKEHQSNYSNWFAKLDLSNFFPAHTLEYVMESLLNIYPIGILMEQPEYREELRACLKYAFYEDKLPQGTPLSPTLTNILMTPLDDYIQKTLWNRHSNFCYTRYADDMLISSVYDFKKDEIEQIVVDAIKKFNAPFEINKAKTRYGSKNGNNWNLGIMLNKDNNLTIGHKNKHRFKALLFNLIMDYINGVRLGYEEKQIISGQISYYKMIEPKVIDDIIKKYEKDFGVSLKTILNLKLS